MMVLRSAECWSGMLGGNSEHNQKTLQVTQHTTLQCAVAQGHSNAPTPSRPPQTHTHTHTHTHTLPQRKETKTTTKSPISQTFNAYTAHASHTHTLNTQPTHKPCTHSPCTHTHTPVVKLTKRCWAVCGCAWRRVVRANMCLVCAIICRPFTKSPKPRPHPGGTPQFS